MSAEKTCSVCGIGMYEGFIIWGGEEYVCTKFCLNKRFKSWEIEALDLGGDDSDSCWSSWDDEAE